MSYLGSNLAYAEVRREGRDEVHHRARAFGPDAQALSLLVVNISPHGLMARCDTVFQPGDRIRVNLPVVGTLAAEVRWSLGGRIGLQFDAAIDLASYYELIARLIRQR
ncbi:PilZ domain-containing protein [Sphingomonas canadensis]|uniref:PilZ domain-containing protein n=1 Tax=Sphingomonas canadensis TaxID=1219257 RepID=A0ABW3HBA8_9SPHN|nr:PilZ domain-containing protein [Sphingomonas canadensis]MCW3837778.1 PilZ domain-containing protein [Sphingomonas canadensis]